MAFDDYVYSQLPDIHNKPEIFGEQRILDEKDQITGHVDKLLINATAISFYDLHGLMAEYGGFYFPAHIDRDSFSLLSNLGFVPPDCQMDAIEIKDLYKYQNILDNNPVIENLPILVNSDAHYLWDISEPIHKLNSSLSSFLLNWIK